MNAAQSTTHCTCHATATATKVAMRGVECGLAMESTCIIGRSLRAENHFLTAGAAHERNVAKPERVSDNGNGAETHSGRRDHRAQQQTEKGYCQVEGFKADSTPRYGRRRILEPHDIGPRFANLTVPSGLKEGFVSSGPYRFTRNPQYLGDMILFIGLSVIVNSLYVRIIHALMILVFAIAPLAEETWLEDQYGEVYREYKRATSRFL